MLNLDSEAKLRVDGSEKETHLVSFIYDWPGGVMNPIGCLEGQVSFVVRKDAIANDLTGRFAEVRLFIITWVFPQDRFIEYGPEDESWAIPLGFCWRGKTAFIVAGTAVLDFEYGNLTTYKLERVHYVKHAP